MTRLVLGASVFGCNEESLCDGGRSRAKARVGRSAANSIVPRLPGKRLGDAEGEEQSVHVRIVSHFVPDRLAQEVEMQDFRTRNDRTPAEY
ncbi:MAG: hypothetical protein ABIZ64_05100 [Casimicrobium sp.]